MLATLRTSLESSIMSCPATMAVPLVGTERPISMRMVVVFPAPLGPRNPKTSPLLTSMFSSLTATKSP